MNEGTPIIVKKKKVHGGHGHHGGSWKVAYADFVTAMMAFFMVMWIMGLSDDTRAQVAGYFNDPMGIMKSMPQSNNIMRTFQAPPRYVTASKENNQFQDRQAQERASMNAIKKKLTAVLIVKAGVGTGHDMAHAPGTNTKGLDLKALASQVQITMTPEGLVIDFVERAGSVFFESGSAIVRPEAKAIVLKVAKILGASNRYLRIEGHTDAKPYSDGGYDNWDLSGDRANAMRHVLCEGGVKDWQVLRVEGLADRDPKVKDDPYNFANRRVTILLPFDDEKTATVVDKNEIRLNNQAEFNKSVLIRPEDLSAEDKDKVEKHTEDAARALIDTGHGNLVPK